MQLSMCFLGTSDFAIWSYWCDFTTPVPNIIKGGTSRRPGEGGEVPKLGTLYSRHCQVPMKSDFLVSQEKKYSSDGGTSQRYKLEEVCTI